VVTDLRTGTARSPDSRLLEPTGPPSARADAAGRPRGLPVTLFEYPATTITNRGFGPASLEGWDRFFLPESLSSLVDQGPLGSRDFVEDDNRSAVCPVPAATLDGTTLYLSVKGVGSTVDPFSLRRLNRAYAAELSDSPNVRERLHQSPLDPPGGVITGELWLRGSPYGGQGLLHALTALRVSERAHYTDLNGFRIAPVVKIAHLPGDLEDRLRSIHWYRKYPGRFVQELRLVPSNIRIYFHGKTTVGTGVGEVFDAFAVDSSARAHRFEINFVKSGIAFLTLFARTMAYDPVRERYSGFDFQDVWLDKDAVLAPDGTIFFVDLEGIGQVSVERGELAEKFEDQIYRSLYEFMFAYEQIDRERGRRFGEAGTRKRRFEALLEEALRDDPFIGLERDARSLRLVLRSAVIDESLKLRFPLVDF
jgi:hypothetical protein